MPLSTIEQLRSSPSGRGVSLRHGEDLLRPPTLVGTVYGMNFDHMPELHWLMGYPWALGLMVLSAVLPYWWFKRKGWL
jgi:hypothetical protein